MKRKGISLVVLLAAVGGILYFLCFFQKQQPMSAYMKDGEEIEVMISSRTETTDELLTGISFNGYEAAYDNTGRRWFYSLIEEDEGAFDPKIEVCTTRENVQIALEKTEITPELISENKTIRLLAYTDDSYCEYEIVCITLPIVELTLESFVSQEEDTDCKVRVFDNRSNAGNRVTVSDGACHIRGMSSAAWEKKGFRLSLKTESLGGNTRENKISLLGMRQDDDLVLYAAYNDQEKIRNVFSSKVWKDSCAENNEFGVENGMEYRYVELFMYGQYFGLYALGYPIDEKQLQLNTSGSSDTWEYSYKKKNWLEETVELMWNPGEVPGYALYGKEKGEEDLAWQPLKDYYCDTLEAGPNDIERVYDAIDIGSAIDVYLFVNLVQGKDNISKNTYFTAKYQEGDYRIMFTPWDLDLTWGNVNSSELPYGTECYGMTPDENVIMDHCGVTKLLELQDEKIVPMITSRYQELRSTTWSEEYLGQLLDMYENDIFSSGAFLRDRDRWPEGNYVAPEQGLAEFREYVRERLSYMDEFVAGLSVE